MWGEMIKSAEVVNASLIFLEKRKRLVFPKGIWKGKDRDRKKEKHIPTNPILIKFPTIPLCPIKHLLRKSNIPLHPLRNLPLAIILPGRRSRNKSPRKNFLIIAKNRLTPPFQFSRIFRRGKTSDEGARGCGIPLDCDGHILELGIIGVGESCHSSGNPCCENSIAGAEGGVVAGLGADFEEFGGEGSCAEDGVGGGERCSICKFDSDAVFLVVELKSGNFRNDVFDAQLDGFFGDGAKTISCSSPSTSFVQKNFFDAFIICFVEESSKESFGLCDRNGFEICLSTQFLIIVENQLRIITPTRPPNSRFVVIWFPEIFGAENVLCFECESAVYNVVVVGADHFVPVPRGGHSAFGVVCIPIYDGDGRMGIFLDEVIGCRDSKHARSDDEI